MAVTIDKYSVQLSANAQALSNDLNNAGKDVDKFSEDVDKKTGKGFSLKGARKSVKGITKDVAFLGFAVDQIGDALGINAESGLGKIAKLTKDVAFGWAVGGVIGAGVGAVVGLLNTFGQPFDEAGTKRVKARIDELGESAKTAAKANGEVYSDNVFERLERFKQAASEEKSGTLERKQAIDALIKSKREEAETAGMTEKQKAIREVQKLELPDVFRGGKPSEKAVEIGAVFDAATFSKFAQNWKEQMGAVGKTGEALDRYKISLLGLPGPLEEVAFAAEKAFRKAELHADMQKLTDTLYDQSYVLGLTATQTKIYQAAKEGATQSDIDAAIAAGKFAENAQRAVEESKGIRTLQGVSLASAAGVEAQQRELRAQQAPDEKTGWEKLQDKIAETKAVQEAMATGINLVVDLLQQSSSVDTRDL